MLDSRLLVPSLLALAACTEPTEPGKSPGSADDTMATDRVVVALEEDSSVAVLEEAGGDVVGTVDLSDGDTKFDVHNVQGAPDGRTAWATAMPVAEDGGMVMADEELVGIDVGGLAVTSRIPLGSDLHLAHVVTDGTLAWVTAKDADLVFEVDLAAEEVLRSIALPDGTGPHGLRRTPDGSTLVVAGMDGGTMVLVDLASGEATAYDVGGTAVQAAVLPDGSAAFVSVYDTKQVARLALDHHEIELFDLPEGAAGPVQIYPTPDSMGLWVADQGYLGDDPAGDHLYRLDSMTGEATLTATVSPAPHGVVIDEAGTTVWTTTLVDGTVDRVDAVTGERLSSTPVGDGPNGVSCMHDGGAMP